MEMQILKMREFSSYKDYMIDRVKKVITSCKNKDQLMVAIDYASLAAGELGGDWQDWMEYFRTFIFDRAKEIKKKPI